MQNVLREQQRSYEKCEIRSIIRRRVVVSTPTPETAKTLHLFPPKDVTQYQPKIFTS